MFRLKTSVKPLTNEKLENMKEKKANQLDSTKIYIKKKWLEERHNADRQIQKFTSLIQIKLIVLCYGTTTNLEKNGKSKG